MSLKRREFIRDGAACTILVASVHSVAQSPVLDQVRLVVGFPPGGVPDAIARLMAEGMRGAYARVALVENKPGASARLAVEEVLRGAGDGSVMLVAPDASLTQFPHSDPKNAPYKPEDFDPVSAVGYTDHGFAVGPVVPMSVRTMRGFIAWIKANPALANFGTPGFGSAHDILMQIAMKEHGFTMTHIPYRGSINGVQDVLGGQLAAIFAPLGTLLPHAGGKGLRLLATSGTSRSPFAPEVPTFSEQGIPELVQQGWFGIWMKKGTPESIVERAQAVVQATLARSESMALLQRLAINVEPLKGRAFDKLLREEYRLWAQRVHHSGYNPRT